MDDQLQEDWLDARLREEAPYLDDDGFTARVMQQLPPAGQTRSSRAVILIGISLIASALAYLLSGRGDFLAHAATFLVAIPLSNLCLVAIGICAVLTAAGATAAVARVREPRL